MMAQPFNVGIVGYGSSAKTFHIPLITCVAELKLYAVVQRNPTAENNSEKDLPGIKSYRSTQDMVRDEAVDVVVVTTIPETHFELAKLALESGKHVVVEKPFTPTFTEAEELISIAKQSGRLLTVYQNRRWDADFLTLAQLLENNTLGRLVEFETHFDRYRPEVVAGAGWKTKPTSGGGAIYDLGTHLIDQVVISLGMPRRITAFIGSQRQPNPTGFEDSFTVLLHYDGVLATIKAGVVSPEVKQLRFWIRGVNGSYQKYHMDCQEEQLKAGKRPTDSDFGAESADRSGTLTTIENGIPSKADYPNVAPLTYTAFYSQLAQALAGKGEVPVKPEGAASVIRLIELAQLSSKEGRTLVV